MHAQQINDCIEILEFSKGEGVWVTDINDNKYLDSTGGLWFYGCWICREEIEKQFMNKFAK